jgi:carbonic anhydrase/acetyltransferase-like protein (isoleucine patch superfamily)
VIIYSYGCMAEPGTATAAPSDYLRRPFCCSGAPRPMMLRVAGRRAQQPLGSWCRVRVVSVAAGFADSVRRRHVHHITLDGISPTLDESAWAAPGSTLIGQVTLEPRSSVWFGAVLRGDNERITVGEGSNVQDGCVLHTDIGFPLRIGASVTVGHLAMLHGCTVEDGCLIGIGATVLNGAILGRGSIVGAHAFVGEGKEIPPGSLVLGSPGRVVRETTDEERRATSQGAAKYAENAQRYHSQLLSTVDSSGSGEGEHAVFSRAMQCDSLRDALELLRCVARRSGNLLYAMWCSVLTPCIHRCTRACACCCCCCCCCCCWPARNARAQC